MLPDRLAFIDLETTGANPEHDRITEIGIVEKNPFRGRENLHLIDAWRYLGTRQKPARPRSAAAIGGACPFRP